jgi:hypothetical protein
MKRIDKVTKSYHELKTTNEKLIKEKELFENTIDEFRYENNKLNLSIK